jgi:hydrogenase expression/formation protein HypE
MHKPTKISIKNDKVTLNHGAGGSAMQQLIKQVFHKAFANQYLAQGNDGALLPKLDKRLVMATDSYVITPLFFPGGNIGELAINGTLNDLAVSGAKPLYLSVSVIIEEGFSMYELKKIVDSMAIAAKKSGVYIVTGDTKVVERGACDGIYINTTGLGEIDNEITIPGKPNVGDKILINGGIGEHGITILSHRENLSFTTDLVSDCASLTQLVANMLEVVPEIKCMRDPTRGGVACVLNEWAQQYNLSICIDEQSIPIKQQVQSACELLGLDPLSIANEGKLLTICPAQYSERLLSVMQQHEEGRNAAIIGEVISDTNSQVLLKTNIGGTRLVDWIAGEQLPRIC